MEQPEPSFVWALSDSLPLGMLGGYHKAKRCEEEIPCGKGKAVSALCSALALESFIRQKSACGEAGDGGESAGGVGFEEGFWFESEGVGYEIAGEGLAFVPTVADIAVVKSAGCLNAVLGDDQFFLQVKELGIGAEGGAEFVVYFARRKDGVSAASESR